MFDLSNTSAVREIITRDGDRWLLKPGSLRVEKTVLKFETEAGESVQTHVTSVASVVSGK